ncbi:DUF1223 domain-containing protein [Paracoccus xiamenensis]|uniref:DUF1223 domain-containing protein n=1 Tax=Paracoccus xiamenensis TaxID=2714901 RepID=UPI00140B93A3|nr:DUF1223 domain-containing protein [Paracoccus xiamenensis]NHF74202.1 DUF1223 domain-containing protein [Paracoccus xiamenensis]
MMHQARQIPFALLALTFLAVPATADTSPHASRPVPSGAAIAAPVAPRSAARGPHDSLQRVMDGFDAATGVPQRLAQSEFGGSEDLGGFDSQNDLGGYDASDYGDIMDDVDAVIDAMRDEVAPDAPQHDFAAEATGSDEAPAAKEPSGSDISPAPTPAGPSARNRQGPHARSPVVVELFTSQGCIDCPPADNLLADLATQGDVLALSWHVDYWDYLGWPDEFARPEFSQRQKGYNLSWGARSLFTPQIVVGGETPIDLPRPADVAMAIDMERAEGDHVAITRRESGNRSEIELTPQGRLPPSIAVQLVRYLPERIVEVQGGENRGRRLVLRNVVAASEVLATWDGRAPLRLTVTLGAGRVANLPADTRHALIVQQLNGKRPGEIFAAVLLD